MDSSMECASPPTICDLDNEKQCKRKLKGFLTTTVSFVDKLKNFIESETKVVLTIWKMTVKLRELDKRKKPKLDPGNIAEEAYQDHLADLHEVICNHDDRLKGCEKELDTLHDQYRAFEGSCTKLDWDMDLEIIRGNEFQRPLKYFLEKGEEVVHEARFIMIHLRLVFNAIKLHECTSVEDYKKALKISDDILDLMGEFSAFSSLFLKYNKRT